MDNPYPICENCIFVDEPLDKGPCQECNRAFLAQRIKPNFVSKRKPQTNADRIRNMTDEELGFLIAWNSYETPPWCREHEECPFIGLDHVPCENCALDWLKQEAAE